MMAVYGRLLLVTIALVLSPLLVRCNTTPPQPNVQCPDKQSSCPDGTTCCQLPTKQWGCCPMASAVCCSDGTHCCPGGTTCNLSEMTCDNTTSRSSLSWMEKATATPGIQCPDGSSCAKGSSWCQSESNGPYACCPFDNAVCCSDLLHCCPESHTCDPTTGMCMGRTLRKWTKRYQAIVRNPIIYPDQQSQCPENTTCCELEDESYGCCPMPEAVCCTDKEHCCPHDTECDLEHQTCTKGRKSVKWWTKTASYPVNDITCPDKKSKCPSGATCCQLDDQSYGCCPLPQAVCCEDHEHCCPTGTTCNLEEETCTSARRGTKIPWFEKFHANKN